MVQSIFALTQNFNESRVIENVSSFKSKSLWYRSSKVWFLIQIILILDFNCCYGWGKEEIPWKDASIQMGKLLGWLYLLNPIVIFHSHPPIMQSFLLKFSKQISIFSNVNQWFLQTNQKVLHFYIFSK